ncbi:MAG TPA: DNA-3-methyladenine glycosylase, partial [Candidatus Wallbacteria bacterium]|nr:DNA-3-methyladenine glycosylase [Candidatus Wallbacteria bacterium]
MTRNKKALGVKFYEKDTLAVARELLGCVVCVKRGETLRRAEIIETEAYCGESDLACHASKGRTKRTEVMFGPAGRAYVYMIYGMYFCLNFVTEKEGS